MGNFSQTLRNIGIGRLAIMGIVTLLMIGFFAILLTKMSAQPMALLYSDLSTGDAGAIGQKLDALKIPFEVNPEGTSIKVQADQVGRARMALAQDGLPKGGSVGYEIFDQNQGFGTTSFMQNLNQVRALEGELARTVSSLGPVKSARIHLVLPKRELFSRDEQAATASVVLQMRPGAVLNHDQVSAIRHLIASSVPQLKPGQISVVDDSGNLLAKVDDANSADDQLQTSNDLRHEYETRLAHQIETLVGRTVGDGKVRATVTADLDFDRISTNQESYDPDQQVVRSTQTVGEKNDNQDSAQDGSVSVANNLPGGKAPASSGTSTNAHGQRNEETVNYEIGKTTRTQVREGGQVRKMSVAVLVDGTYQKDKDGKSTYQPRSKEEMTQIEAIVKSAVGFDQKRGDAIEVQNMPFVNEADTAGASSEGSDIMGFARADIIKFAETAVLGIVALLVMLLVVRPILNRAMTMNVAGSPGPSLPGNPMLSPGPSMPALSAPTSDHLETMGGATGMGESAMPDSMIDIEQVDGRVRQSALKRIGEIVDKHPAESVSILRGWMYQET